MITHGVYVAASSGAENGKMILAVLDAPKVELYITEWCPYCRKVIKFFQSREIPYVVYDIEKDVNAARRKNELDIRKGVPFAIIHGKSAHGFSGDAYRRSLDSDWKNQDS